jgi:hypothetical protein
MHPQSHGRVVMGDGHANMQFTLSCVGHFRKLFPSTGTSERRARPVRKCHGGTLVAARGAA